MSADHLATDCRFGTTVGVTPTPGIILLRGVTVQFSGTEPPQVCDIIQSRLPGLLRLKGREAACPKQGAMCLLESSVWYPHIAAATELQGQGYALYAISMRANHLESVPTTGQAQRNCLKNGKIWAVRAISESVHEYVNVLEPDLSIHIPAEVSCLNGVYMVFANSVLSHRMGYREE